MSESNEYHGEERRYQEPPSKIPKFIREYVVLWVLGIVGTAVWFGGMAYVDTRHVQRSEFMGFMYRTSEVRLLDKIEEADATITRNQLFNQLGSQTNRPARDQVILQTEDRKGKWERELTSLQQSKPAP
jgi:hypothetical protein